MNINKDSALFISNFSNNDLSRLSDGVSKKIQGQINGLNAIGYNTSFTYLKNNIYYIKYNNKIYKLFKIKKSNYINRILLFYYLNKFFSSKEITKIIYIRGLRVNYTYFHFLKIAYQKKCRIFIEIPTLITNNQIDILGIGSILADQIDKYMMNRINQYIEAYINFQNFKKISKKKAIAISNGVNINTPQKKLKRNVIEHEIHLLAIALMLPTHGYERIIKGLYQYYSQKQENKVFVHLVGSGVETPYYKALTKKYHLSKYVNFYEPAYGDRLNELFDEADIGLGSFGIYKIGSNIASILKIKEYCARGIPFVYGCYEKELCNVKDFCLRLPNNNTTIDINIIVNFYYETYKHFNETQSKMIAFAKQNYTWEKQWKKILHE